MTGIIAWLSFGLGFWAATSLFRPHTFKQATAISILRGLLLCVLAWPICIVLVIKLTGEE